MQQLHTGPLQSSHPPSVTSAQVATLSEPSLDPARVWSHDTACDFSTLVFSALAGIITLSVGELCLLFIFSIPLEKAKEDTIQVLWPLLASLANELLGIRGTCNLVWFWKDIE